MDRATYWATKSPLPEYWAVTFEHPAFEAPFRLVADQFAPVTLGGNVFQPAPMTIKPPEQKSDSQPRMTITFPRQVVGREFKRQLRLITALASREPIEVTFEIYLAQTLTPQTTWRMYASDAGGINFSGDAVQITAGLDNPMRRAVAPVYDPATFTGLEVI